MKRLGYTFPLGVVLVTALAVSLIPAAVLATPNPNSAIVKERVFNDCLLSTLTTVNNYPASISISDAGNQCFGFANLHVWRFSEDGMTDVPFMNDDAFRFCADLVISGDGEGEAGLQIAPWWAQDVDGRFNVRSTDGEIACFGGRLPFYSFTAAHGINYAKGDMIHLEMVYLPNGLSAADPATVEYKLTYNSVDYTSGPLAFDEGNPAEDPPYGLWGMLNDGRAGGHVQVLWQAGGPNTTLTAEWSNICFEDLSSIPVEQTTWGKIKKQYE